MKKMNPICSRIAFAALALTTLATASSAHAQTTSEALKASVSNQSLQQQLNALKAQVTALQNQLTVAKNVLALAPFVRVDPNPELGVTGPNITFTGANLHLVSGSGATNDGGNPRGLGNLIIGYNENPGDLGATDRGGSHNLVIGSFNKFTRFAFGGLVAGEFNAIGNEAASVTGGNGNTASGQLASVTGGQGNTASGQLASVTGGQGNTASGLLASVTGGDQNTASGEASSVTGGLSNTASGLVTVVLGTQNVTEANSLAVAPIVAP